MAPQRARSCESTYHEPGDTEVDGRVDAIAVVFGVGIPATESHASRVSDISFSRESLALQAALADRYTFERELGAGGMATVFLVRDVKHDRHVALKVLRPELAAVIGAERFLQEIKTTASLQHPHILGLIDSGENAHQLWYAMPFVDGESLRDRITREKQLPVGEAVRLVVEVAGALDYAHRRGVIHRDIKPENILLQDGRALVADFGIALAASKAGGSRMTETGMSLGTPQYMSPEQAMGEREITARSDVYALGCVLYALLIGEPPFTGPTPQAIVARVMTGEPAPLTAARKTIPPHVEAAVLQALQKLPADRFASAAEFALALGNPSFAPSTAASHSLVRGRPMVAWLPWVFLAAALSFISFEQIRPKAESATEPVYRLNIMLPDSAEWAGDVVSSPVLSPDGRMLVYNGRDSSSARRLYLRVMDKSDPIPIPGSENGSLPFFSSDGRRVAFSLGARIMNVAMAGSAPETVCESGGLARATWLENDTIIFATRTGLMQCASNGQVTTLLKSASGERFDFPHGLPNDRGVLFGMRGEVASRLMVIDPRTRAVKPLDILGSDPRYVATGHVVYVNAEGRLRAVPFDLKSLAVMGEPIAIDEQVRVEIGGANMALSRNGTMIIPGIGSQALVLVDRSGKFERLHAKLGDFGDPQLSPDGRRLAVRLDNNIWLLDRTQGTLTRLTFDSAASRPVWSMDAHRVAYTRQIGRRVDARIINPDGNTKADSLLALPSLEVWEVLFAPNDRSILVRTVGGPGRRDVWLSSLDSISPLKPLLTTAANEVAPALSPDGRWLAYVSDESGRDEVYVRSFPGMAGRYQVSRDGGAEPVWSPRGGELFYRSGPLLLAAEIRAGTSFEVARHTPLFSDGSYVSDGTHAVYDVTPDGSHFVMIKRLQAASYMTVTLNRFANLRDRGAAARR